MSGSAVVPGRHGGCAILLAGPLQPMAIVAVVAQVARYPLDDTLVVPCDVNAIARSDARVVDTLARLTLGLKRQGRRMRVEGASPRLLGLLTLCGLRDIVVCGEPAA